MHGVSQLLNDPLDCEWVRDVHLNGHKLPQFGSFEIVGNEDAPEVITLHVGKFPTVLDKPLAQFRVNSRGILKLLQGL